MAAFDEDVQAVVLKVAKAVCTMLDNLHLAVKSFCYPIVVQETLHENKLIFFLIICLLCVISTLEMSSLFYLILKDEELVQWLSNLSNIVLCIVGIVSAIIVYSTYKHNNKLAEAKFASKYEEKYYTRKMYTYIRTLADFRDKKQKGGKTSLEQFIRRKTDYCSRTSKDNRDKRIEFMPDYQMKISPKVNAARRAVQNYFSSALELYEVKIISRETFIRIIDKSAFCLFFDVIEPLMFLENKSYRHRKFYKLMKEGGYLYEERQKEMVDIYWRERVWQECSRHKRRRRRRNKK